jgi:tRNA A-37 threonylcarbamoyl transferase component Bud32
MTIDVGHHGLARIERLERGGEVLWIKRAEALSLRMRLQKGDPLAAFGAERASLKRYAALGLPVPPIVEDGPDFVMTEDTGPTLRQMISGGSGDLHAALTGAGKGLARFHAAGVTHGRPYLKDICWKDGEATFIDLERAGKGSPALDLTIFLFSVTADTRGDSAAFRAARDAYLGAGDPEVWKTAKARIARLRPLAFLCAPVRWVQPRNREFGAVKNFLRFALD